MIKQYSSHAEFYMAYEVQLVILEPDEVDTDEIKF
jgi:hypothetical protein